MKYTKDDFLKQMAIEQQFYYHSLRAWLLRYDSFMLSRYFYHLRMVEYHELTPPIYGTSLWLGGISTECASMVA